MGKTRSTVVLGGSTGSGAGRGTYGGGRPARPSVSASALTVTMADADARTDPRDPDRPARERDRLARVRERVLSGFAPEDDDLSAIVGPLAEVLAGEVFVVTDLRRIGSPLVHVEPGFEALTGYAPEVAVGRDLGFLLRNDTDQDAVREAREAVRDGRAATVTLRNYRADGSLFWCEQRHHPVRDARGQVGHLVTVLRDVSDQVNARSVEAVTREGMAGTADDTPWFAYGALIDARGALTVSWASGATTAVLGLEPDAVVRDGWASLVAEGDRPAYAARAAALRRDGGSRRDRYRVTLPGGATREVEDFATLSWVAAEAGLVAIHGVVRDVSPRRAIVGRAFAGVDATTGLPTEEVAQDRLGLAARRAQRQRRQVALVAISLDHFEFVRTHMDAQRGERLVREAARRMRRALRRSDTLARVGPGDFLVVLDDLGEADAVIPVIEKLIAWVARPFDDGLLRVELSASAGVALATGPARLDALRGEASEALARAQRAGGGRFAFFDRDLDRRLRSRRRFELELRGAFAAGEWELHYQPRVRLAGGDVTAVEALVRWRHPERGLLPPAEFLPELERVRLTGELFEHVLPLALQRVAGWTRRRRDRRIAVNLGAAELERDDLVDFVGRTLERAAVAPASLELELHQGSDPRALARSVERLGELRRLGVRLAFDDFGVVDTNLAQLRELPLDVLKIDRTFVGRLSGEGGLGDPADLEVLRAMVALGRGLGLTVVAEGIETDFQRARLRAFACDEGQGFLFAAPSPDVDLSEEDGTAGDD